MVEPSIGPARAGTEVGCAYSPTPEDPQCPEAAAWHVMTRSREYGTVAVESCDGHLSIAQAAGDLVAEHPAGAFCGLPSTYWAETNACALIDSSYVEFDGTVIGLVDRG